MKKKIIIGIILIAVIAIAGIAFVVGRRLDPDHFQSEYEKYYPHTDNSRPEKNESAVESPMPATSQAVAPAAPEDTVSAQIAVKEFTVIGKNYSFAPSTLSVKKGDTVKIIFKNVDGFHDWRIDEFQAGTQRIQAGQDDTITFVADKTGQFEFYCSVGSHRSMGMRGTLTVE